MNGSAINPNNAILLSRDVRKLYIKTSKSKKPKPSVKLKTRGIQGMKKVLAVRHRHSGIKNQALMISNKPHLPKRQNTVITVVLMYRKQLFDASGV